MSGLSQCKWAVLDTVGEYTRMLAKDLNCQSSSSKELLDCLRNKDAKEIVEFRGKIALSFVSL